MIFIPLIPGANAPSFTPIMQINFSDGSKYNRKLNRQYLPSKQGENNSQIIRKSRFFSHQNETFFAHCMDFHFSKSQTIGTIRCSQYLYTTIVKKIHSKIIFWTFEPSLLTFFPLDQSEKWQTIKYCLAILQYYLYRLPNFSLDFQCTIKISRNSGGLEIIRGYFVLCYRCDDYNAIEMFIKIRYTPSSYISIYTLQVQITRNKIKEINVYVPVILMYHILLR